MMPNREAVEIVMQVRLSSRPLWEAPVAAVVFLLLAVLVVPAVIRWLPQ